MLSRPAVTREKAWERRNKGCLSQSLLNSIMDTSYGIGVANRYALFMGDEDQDPMDPAAVHPSKGGKENKPGVEKSSSAPPAKKAASSAPSKASGKQTAATSQQAPTQINQNSGPVAASRNKTPLAPKPASGPQNSGSKRDAAPSNSSDPAVPRGPNRSGDPSAPKRDRGPRDDRGPRSDRPMGQFDSFFIRNATIDA